MTQSTESESAEKSDVAGRGMADAFLKKVKHKQPKTVSVKEFLGYWGYRKRGAHILRLIDSELAARGLTSSPDIAIADYYGEVQILDQRDLAEAAELEIGWPISSVLDVERELVAVGPDESLRVIETLMILNDFSQIPVMNKSRRDLYGSVTWQSIARWSGDRAQATAKQVMERDGQTARSSDSLLLHINRIVDHEYLYIQDPTGLFVGILTATDLAEGFLATAGPFIKLGEVENRLRALVNLLPLPVIQQAESHPAGKAIKSASDLMFGQYVAILEKIENWDQLGLPYDRVTMIDNLRAVNQVRNEVMHFRLTELDSPSVDAIDKCLNLLRAIRGK